MPALNYSERFAGPVDRGEKRQTIRARRKRPIKKGERLYHFTGMRTKACRRLRAGHEDHCRDTRPITIDMRVRVLTVTLDGRKIEHEEACRLARADGFPDLIEFVVWFRDHHGLPFVGDVITW